MSNLLDKDGMIQTENDSPPDDWRFVKLGEVSYEVTERNHNRDHSRGDVLGVNNESGLIPSDRLLGEDFARYKLVGKNRFAYNPMRLNVGSIGLWSREESKIVSPDYVVFGCEESLDPDFLDLFRQSAAWRRQIQQSGQGSVRIRYYYRHISKFLIPLPPLAEQKAIARVLRTVERAKDATEKVIAATRQLKQSLMKHLFTYGPLPFDQADKVEVKETETGLIRNDWPLRRLGEVAKVERGKFAHRPRNDPRFYGGSIPFIQTGDVARSGGRVTSYTQKLNDLGLSVSRIFPKGTIVLTIAANIGDAAILEFDSAFPDSLVGITPAEKLNSDFLCFYLQTQKERMDKLAPKGTQKNINIAFLEPWLTPVPSLPDQLKIVESLSSVQSKLQKEEYRSRALDSLFETLLHHLLTGKIRLSLDMDQILAKAF